MILERPAVTARLEVDFRAPALLGKLLEIEAWLERAEGRKLYLAARVSHRGQAIAEGQGLFVEVPIEHFSSEARSVWEMHDRGWPS